MIVVLFSLILLLSSVSGCATKKSKTDLDYFTEVEAVEENVDVLEPEEAKAISEIDVVQKKSGDIVIQEKNKSTGGRLFIDGKVYQYKDTGSEVILISEKPRKKEKFFLNGQEVSNDKIKKLADGGYIISE